MAVQSIGSLDAIFRAYDDKNVKKLFATSDGFMKEVKKYAKVIDVNQKGKTDTNRYRTHAAVKFGGPGMTYAEGVNFKFDQYHAYPVNQEMTLEINDMTWDDLNSSGSRRENALMNIQEMIEAMVEGLTQDRSQHFAGGNGNAAKGTLTGSTTTTSLVFYTSPGGLPNRSFGCQQIYPDVVYDILTSAGAEADASHVNVTFTESQIDYTTNTITLGSALGAAPAAGSILVKADSYNYGVRGLPYLVSGTKTGFWQGTIVTGRPEHQSVHLDASGAAISVALHQKISTKMKIRNRGAKSYKIVGPPNQNDAYRAIGWNFRRFASSDKAFDLEFDESRYNGNPFLDFFEIDSDRQYLLDLADFEIIQSRPFGILNRDGLVWRQKVGSGTGEGNYYLNYGGADNLKIRTPKSHGVLLNLEVNSDHATVAGQFATT